MIKLVGLTERPKDSTWLLEVWADTKDLMLRCFEGLKDIHERSWERILTWLASANRETTSKDPMNVYLKRATVDRYATYWQRFICFCLRALEEESVGFQFTQDQLVGLQRLRELYILDIEEEDAIRQKKKQLLVCSLKFIKQTVYEVGVPALVYYSGILGYSKESGHWRQPENFTNILAGLLWCMRVLVLEYTLPTMGRDRIVE
ncbi:MAG TPA: hypothetical protein VGN34_32365, partial [Ktedonobacteraceae bacterium]